MPVVWEGFAHPAAGTLPCSACLAGLAWQKHSMDQLFLTQEETAPAEAGPFTCTLVGRRGQHSPFHCPSPTAGACCCLALPGSFPACKRCCCDMLAYVCLRAVIFIFFFSPLHHHHHPCIPFQLKGQTWEGRRACTGFENAGGLAQR